MATVAFLNPPPLAELLEVVMTLSSAGGRGSDVPGSSGPTWPLWFSFRKKELLSRDDLQLPWRPLYQVYERVVYSKTEHLGLVWFPR